jgi:hypothetical protein
VGTIVRFVCDAPGGKTWFQIETEAEAALESALMQHAVEKHFRQAREHAKMSYVPPSGSYIEQDIGLKAHLQRVMPVLLTLRDQDGNGLATAMLPPASQDVRSVRPVIVGVGNSDPYPEHGAAIWVLGEHVGRVLDQLPADPHLVWVWAMRRDG